MKISKVKAIDENYLELEDYDGCKYILSATYWKNLPLQNYSELNNPDYFLQVGVSECFDTIQWPGGQDIAPEDIDNFAVPISMCS